MQRSNPIHNIPEINRCTQIDNVSKKEYVVDCQKMVADLDNMLLISMDDPDPNISISMHNHSNNNNVSYFSKGNFAEYCIDQKSCRRIYFTK